MDALFVTYLYVNIHWGRDERSWIVGWEWRGAFPPLSNVHGGTHEQNTKHNFF